MAELKTKPNQSDVGKFMNSIQNPLIRSDYQEILKMMSEITHAEPKMWGSSIVGFGSYHYKYESGREGDWFWTGFSPRKQNITLYIMSGLEQITEILKQLGKFKTAKSCLYIKKLDDINRSLLSQLIRQSVKTRVKI